MRPQCSMHVDTNEDPASSAALASARIIDAAESFEMQPPRFEWRMRCVVLTSRFRGRSRVLVGKIYAMRRILTGRQPEEDHVCTERKARDRTVFHLNSTDAKGIPCNGPLPNVAVRWLSLCGNPQTWGAAALINRWGASSGIRGRVGIARETLGGEGV